MIAYKATYNFKCRNQEYKVGKTYTSDKMEICEYGIHFCPRMEDVLNYYDPKKDFILLEIEVLGDTYLHDGKGVTDKMKVLRVVPPEEYSKGMKRRLSCYEYDSNGNAISMKCLSGNIYRYEYDSNGNMISKTWPSGNVYRYEYDTNGNRISEAGPNGYVYQYKYDSNGNVISLKCPDGDVYRFEVATITESDS